MRKQNLKVVIKIRKGKDIECSWGAYDKKKVREILHTLGDAYLGKIKLKNKRVFCG